jgi:hypothetical protein
MFMGALFFYKDLWDILLNTHFFDGSRVEAMIPAWLFRRDA